MSLWRYEHRSQALASRRAFGWRLAAHALVAPLVHRLLHRLHLADLGDGGDAG